MLYNVRFMCNGKYGQINIKNFFAVDESTLTRFSCKSEKMRALDDKVDLINQKENKAFLRFILG